MKYTHLTREERHTISTLKRKGDSPAIIASTLGRSRSTICRELKRNATDLGGYQYLHADRLSQQRSQSASCRTSRCSPVSWEFAVEKLISQQRSPDQISCELKILKLPSISHETIYLRIDANKVVGGDLHIHLRHKIKSYRNRNLAQDNRGRIPNAISIENRPAVVDERSRLGDWEMDTVIGKASGSVLVTMVERMSRYTIIAKIPNKTADAVATAIMVRLLPHRSKLHTLTFDNGKEFSSHAIIDAILDSSSYFAHPYSSWERGLNENTNGLIRQYFPKGTDFDRITEDQIAEVEQKLNSRPRKCLERKTPASIFFSN
tara:strand:+ start:821 stop:1777 length:957 start_codon:yes stop_codon:yes gene_type:complete